MSPGSFEDSGDDMAKASVDIEVQAASDSSSTVDIVTAGGVAVEKVKSFASS
jgi:hypothetical protein